MNEEKGDAKFLPASTTTCAGTFGAHPDMQYVPAMLGAVENEILKSKYVPSQLGQKNGIYDQTRFIPATYIRWASDTYANSKFIPADVLTSRNSQVEDKGFSVTWWQKDSMFHYDSMLVSAFYGIKIPNYREKYNIPRKGFTLIGDSGGFQVANVEGATMNPANLARWYNENVDKGFILDTPIVKYDPHHKKSMPFDFETALNRTYHDTETMMKITEVPLYGIMHGHNKEQLNAWWKKMSDFHFDAWCGGAKPASDPMLQALMCMQLKEFDIKRVHILGVSGFSVVPVLAYASKYFDFLSYDSGSYGEGAMFKAYRFPQNPQAKTYFGRNEKVHLKTLPCDCEICRWAEPEMLYKEDSLSGALISLHNLIIYIRYNQFMKSIVKDEDYFRQYLQGNFEPMPGDCGEKEGRKGMKPKVLEAIDFIEYTAQNGLDAGYQKYKKYFETETVTPVFAEERGSLFD